MKQSLDFFGFRFLAVSGVMTLSLVFVAVFSQAVSAVDLFNSNDPNTPGVCQNAETKSVGETPQICEANDAQQASSDDLLFGSDGIIALGLNVLSILVGIIAVVVIIISGLRLIVSSGDSNSISAARRALIYAVIGLAIAAVAQAIVRFLLVRL